MGGGQVVLEDMGVFSAGSGMGKPPAGHSNQGCRHRGGPRLEAVPTGAGAPLQEPGSPRSITSPLGAGPLRTFPQTAPRWGLSIHAVIQETLAGPTPRALSAEHRGSDPPL